MNYQTLQEIRGLKRELAQYKANDRPLAIPVSMRLPIQEDAHDEGRVLVREFGLWDTYPWDELPDTASDWARLPDKPCSCEGVGCELCNWRRINAPPTDQSEDHA